MSERVDGQRVVALLRGGQSLAYVLIGLGRPLCNAGNEQASMLVTNRIVDADDPGSWPLPLLELVGAIDADTPPDSYVQDLDVPDDAEERVLAALAGHRLLVRHATRLLPHETDLIREEGLRMFSGELFDDRIDAAYSRGHLSASEHERLRAGHMVAGGEQHSRGDRLDKVCLLVGVESLGDDGLDPLMSLWGGEGIYFAAGTVDLRGRLRHSELRL